MFVLKRHRFNPLTLRIVTWYVNKTSNVRSLYKIIFKIRIQSSQTAVIGLTSQRSEK